MNQTPTDWARNILVSTASDREQAIACFGLNHIPAWARHPVNLSKSFIFMRKVPLVNG